MMKARSVVALFLVCIGCTATNSRVNAAAETKPASAPSSQPLIANIARDYNKMELITPKPACVDLFVLYDCDSPSKAELDAMRERSPHALAYVNIYMNRSARAAFLQKEKYPVGSIIIKEKTGDHDFEPADSGKDKKNAMSRPASKWAGVGGMVKRSPGYNSDHGDWEYFYFDDPAKVESGKFDKCIKCHDGAKDRDYVYGTWMKSEWRNK